MQKLRTAVKFFSGFFTTLVTSTGGCPMHLLWNRCVCVMETNWRHIFNSNDTSSIWNCRSKAFNDQVCIAFSGWELCEAPLNSMHIKVEVILQRTLVLEYAEVVLFSLQSIILCIQSSIFKSALGNSKYMNVTSVFSVLYCSADGSKSFQQASKLCKAVNKPICCLNSASDFKVTMLIVNLMNGNGDSILFIPGMYTFVQ